MNSSGTFYNTIPLLGHELHQAQHRAASQDQLTLKIFEAAVKPLTPSEVHSILIGSFIPASTPLTSIRRSITSLTKAGLLEKTEIRRPGPFGVVNNTWELKDKQLRIAL